MERQPHTFFLVSLGEEGLRGQMRLVYTSSPAAEALEITSPNTLNAQMGKLRQEAAYPGIRLDVDQI